MLSRYWSVSQHGHPQPHSKSKTLHLSIQLSSGVSEILLWAFRNSHLKLSHTWTFHRACLTKPITLQENKNNVCNFLQTVAKCPAAAHDLKQTIKYLKARQFSDNFSWNILSNFPLLSYFSVCLEMSSDPENSFSRKFVKFLSSGRVCPATGHLTVLWR